MRLFVALRPPVAVLDEIDAAVAPYRSEWSPLRWVASGRWHVTLCFLGEVSDGVLPSLRGELDAAAKAHPALGLSFAGAGAFPRVHRARVLWIGMGGDRRELTELAGSVSSAAGSAGLELTRGQRRFSPHLTLARCREPTDLAPLVDTLDGFTGTGWTAGEIHLVRSYLGPKPRYEIAHSWSLDAGLWAPRRRPCRARKIAFIRGRGKGPYGEVESTSVTVSRGDSLKGCIVPAVGSSRRCSPCSCSPWS